MLKRETQHLSVFQMEDLLMLTAVWHLEQTHISLDRARRLLSGSLRNRCGAL